MRCGGENACRVSRQILISIDGTLKSPAPDGNPKWNVLSNRGFVAGEAGTLKTPGSSRGLRGH